MCWPKHVGRNWEDHDTVGPEALASGARVGKRYTAKTVDKAKMWEELSRLVAGETCWQAWDVSVALFPSGYWTGAK